MVAKSIFFSLFLGVHVRVSVMIACPWCVVLGPLPSADQLDGFRQSMVKNDDTAFSR